MSAAIVRNTTTSSENSNKKYYLSQKKNTNKQLIPAVLFVNCVEFIHASVYPPQYKMDTLITWRYEAASNLNTIRLEANSKQLNTVISLTRDSVIPSIFCLVYPLEKSIIQPFFRTRFKLYQNAELSKI